MDEEEIGELIHVCKREKIREGIKKGPMLSNVVAHYIY